MADSCAALEKKRKSLLKKMWDSPLGSKKRVSYEKQANAVLKQLNACRKASKSGKGKGGKIKGGAKGYPDATPEQLWRTDPNQRPADVFGVISGNLMGGEDEVIAVAKGAQTSFKSRPTEDRATIRGGLAVLAMAGRSKVDVKALSSKVVQGPKADAALIRAAGGGSDLKSAANLVRKKVSDAKLERAAWGARGLYILENLKGFSAARGVGATVSALFGPIGMAIGAAMGIHGAVSGKVAEEATRRFKAYVKQGLKGKTASDAVPADERSEEDTALSTEPEVPLSAWPAWAPWAAGGGALVLAALIFRRSSGNRMAA